MVRGKKNVVQTVSAELRGAIERVTAKRPLTVLRHILEHGYITTDELKERYGYNHPPRAARDVREAGIPLETFRVQGPDGRSIAAYRFSTEAIDASRSGRRAFPKAFKDQLIATYGERCAVCGANVPARALQVDHRVPYEIAGETDQLSAKNFMLLCPSCNRTKSWTCEHCSNWKARKVETCLDCAWASPDNYRHVATVQERRVTIVWQGSETAEYDRLKAESDRGHQPIADYLKKVDHRKG